MNRLSFTFIAFLLCSMLSSCAAIGGIFKAGVWAGVLGIAIVVFLIIYFIGRSKN